MYEIFVYLSVLLLVVAIALFIYSKRDNKDFEAEKEYSERIKQKAVRQEPVAAIEYDEHGRKVDNINKLNSSERNSEI